MRHAALLAAALILIGCAGASPTPEPQAISVTVPETQPPDVTAEQTETAQAAAAVTEETVGSTQPPAFAGPCTVTPADGEGPYYLAGAPIQDGFISLVTPNLAGDRLTLSGVIYLEGCQTTLGGAVVEFWQADATGNYDLSGYTLRGGVRTDINGAYTIETIVPPPYGGRPQHIHYKVIVDGRPAFTSQIYFTGDSRAAGFPEAMLINPVATDSGLTALFNIVLAGQ